MAGIFIMKDAAAGPVSASGNEPRVGEQSLAGPDVPTFQLCDVASGVKMSPLVVPD